MLLVNLSLIAPSLKCKCMPHFPDFICKMIWASIIFFSLHDYAHLCVGVLHKNSKYIEVCGWNMADCTFNLSNFKCWALPCCPPVFQFRQSDNACPSESFSILSVRALWGFFLLWEQTWFPQLVCAEWVFQHNATRWCCCSFTRVRKGASSCALRVRPPVRPDGFFSS